MKGSHRATFRGLTSGRPQTPREPSRQHVQAPGLGSPRTPNGLLNTPAGPSLSVPPPEGSGISARAAGHTSVSPGRQSSVTAGLGFPCPSVQGTPLRAWHQVGALTSWPRDGLLWPGPLLRRSLREGQGQRCPSRAPSSPHTRVFCLLFPWALPCPAGSEEPGIRKNSVCEHLSGGLDADG